MNTAENARIAPSLAPPLSTNPCSCVKKMWIGTLVFSALFHLLHFIALPILLTGDGAYYIHLGRLAARLDFSTEYYFARPPLYPLLIEASTRLLGRNAMALQFPNILLGFSAICLASVCVWRIGFPRLACVSVLLLTFYPMIVAYEHCVLTEVGSIFFIFLILWLLLKSMDGKHLWIWTILLGVGVGLSYYQRPTLIYLAPIWGFLRLVCLLSEKNESKPIRARWKRAMVHGLAVGVIGWGLALPWQRALAHSKERDSGNAQLLAGLLKQAVVPPEDPLITDDIRAMYSDGIETATNDGIFDVAGIHQYTIWAMFYSPFLQHHRESGSQVFLASIQRYPQRYLAGVWRTLLLFSGHPSADDENDHFTRLVIHEVNHGGKIFTEDHPLHSTLVCDFAQRTNSTHLSRKLDALRTGYGILLPLGMILTLLAFVIGIWKRSVHLLMISMPPLAFVAIHALALIAVNRYVFPIWPLLLLNVFLIPLLVWRIFRTSEAASI